MLLGAIENVANHNFVDCPQQLFLALIAEKKKCFCLGKKKMKWKQDRDEGKEG